MYQTFSRICMPFVVGLGLLAMANASVAEDQSAAAVKQPSSTGADPTPFRAVYRARYKGFPITATGIRELRKVNDHQYLLTSTAKNFLAKIAEQTTFSIGPDGTIVPDEYQYHRTGIGRNRTAVLTFDWDKMEVLNDVESKPWKMTIEPGVQDKLSYQFELRSQLVAARDQGDDYPELSYKIADGGHLKVYSFKIVGEERIRTPLGVFNTVKATRTDGDPDRVTDFWLAPEYDYLLVKFEQTEPDGDGFELVLRKASFDGKEVKAE